MRRQHDARATNFFVAAMMQWLPVRAVTAKATREPGAVDTRCPLCMHTAARSSTATTCSEDTVRHLLECPQLRPERLRVHAAVQRVVLESVGGWYIGVADELSTAAAQPVSSVLLTVRVDQRRRAPAACGARRATGAQRA